jgi:hypothetical protein
MVSNLALFCLTTVLATFQNIGRFFPNHVVTLLGYLVNVTQIVQILLVALPMC